MKNEFTNLTYLALALACGLTIPHAKAKQPNEGNVSIKCKDGSLQWYNAHIANNLTQEQMAQNAAAREGAIERCGPNGYSDPTDGPIRGNIGSAVSNAQASTAIRPGLVAGATAASEAGGAAPGAPDVVASESGRPGKGGQGNDSGDGKSLPVLNCSQSQNNPASVNLSSGQPGWTLKMPNGSGSAIVAATTMVPSPWTAVPGAQWVSPAPAPTQPGVYVNQPSGDHVYETKVRILKCPKGEPAKLSAQFRADNRGTLTLIDPSGVIVKTMNQAGTPNYGFLQGSLSPAGAPGVHSWSPSANGIYTVRMTVQNSSGPSGMAANVVLTR